MRNKPNIVVILMDTVRRDHVSCYGHLKNITPNIDSIARQSLIFKNAYSTSFWTIPAHASLFTGYYPSEHGTHASNYSLNPNLPTLAEKLKKEGYTTIGCSCNPYISELFGFNRGFSLFKTYQRTDSKEQNIIDWSKFRKGREHIKGLRRYFEIIKYALRQKDRNFWKSLKHGLKVKFKIGHSAKEVNQYLQKLKQEKKIHSPFFIFINYMEGHWPYKPPWRKLNPRYWFFYARKLLWHYGVDAFKYYSGKMKMSRRQNNGLKQLYRGAIKYLDTQIGEIYREFNDKNTIFIILSDHGENFGEHGLLRHNMCVYNTLIKIPLIISGYGIGKTDSVCDITDVYKTVLNIAGIEDEHQYSINLVREPRKSRLAFSERLGVISRKRLDERYTKEVVDQKWDFRLQSIIGKKYKYILNLKNNKEEFYNLKDDSEENKNLQNMEKIKMGEMKKKLNLFVKDFQKFENRAEEKKIDAGVAKQLKDLGYF